MSVLIAGTVALDHVKTPHDEHENLLGGSASYAAIAASFFSPVNLLAIVGKDFPEKHLDLFRRRNIVFDGVQFSEGETFRWSGEYFHDMNSRETLDVALNVLEAYKPTVPESYKNSRIVLLANDSPDNQLSIIDQMNGAAEFIMADTMDLWITIARESLLKLLKRIDLLVLNDSEAKQLLDTINLIHAGERLREMGPKYIVIKKGEHGAMIFGEHRFFTCGAYPLRNLHDPTGAGDSFIGTVAGYLATQEPGSLDFDAIVRGVARGTIIAGYTCESFSTHRLESLSTDEFDTRFAEFQDYSRFH